MAAFTFAFHQWWFLGRRYLCSTKQGCAVVIVYILQRATHLSFLCQHKCIFVEVKLTCLVVVFLLLHSSGRLSSGVDSFPSCLKQWASISVRWMASAGVGWQLFIPWFLYCGRSSSVKKIAGGGCYTFPPLFLLPLLSFCHFPTVTCHLCTLFLLRMWTLWNLPDIDKMKWCTISRINGWEQCLKQRVEMWD